MISVALGDGLGRAAGRLRRRASLVGRGYEFVAITAVVLGGVVLGGGRGWIVAAVAGAFVLEALFLLLNIAGVPVVTARRRAGRHHHRRRRLLGPRVPLPPPRRGPTDFSRPGEETRRARWAPRCPHHLPSLPRASLELTKKQRRLAMRRSLKIATTSVALVGLFALAGCTTDPNVAPPDSSAEPSRRRRRERMVRPGAVRHPDGTARSRARRAGGRALPAVHRRRDGRHVAVREHRARRRPASPTRRSRTRGARPAGSR